MDYFYEHLLIIKNSSIRDTSTRLIRLNLFISVHLSSLNPDCIVIIIILDVHMIRGDWNLFSPLVYTFRMSVLLSSPELRRQVVPNIVRCGPRAVLSPALLSCYRVSAQEIQLYSTTLAVQMQWYCIDLFSWMNAHPEDQMRKQEKMLFTSAWKIKGKDIF